MSVLLATLRESATRLESAVEHLPAPMREEFREAARRQHAARDLVDHVLFAALDALYFHRHTHCSAGDKRNADERLRRVLLTARKGPLST